MARDSFNESDRHCLESSAQSATDAAHDIYTDKSKLELKSQRVRFVDDENITDRFVSRDEVDAAPRVKKVHILKNRSSSDTSILLRTSSLTKHKGPDRPVSVDFAHLKNRERDSLNNNSLSENLSGKFGGILKPILETERLIERTETEKCEGAAKDNELNNFKKNCNVYSVNQAKTILFERKKSLPLSNIPKLIGHRVNDNGLRLPTSSDEMTNDIVGYNKDFTARAIGKISRGIGRFLRRSNSVKISEPDPVYKVAYLGNVLTGWARGENCVEKPLATLWRNYNQSTKPDVVMKLSIASSGLKGATKEHGLTEYWSHRITYCASPPHYPKIFCWVYRHEGRKLKHELRCHAVLCAKENITKKITEVLQIKLKQALAEFKKDKISRQNARLSLANSVYENPTMPRRKILLSIGAHNYRPPLERSKSAPKLGAIEELCSEEEEEECNNAIKTNDCGNEIKDRYQNATYSWRRRTAEKVKSPRKNSLPESIGSESYRRLDVDTGSDSSFSDEIFELIRSTFKPSENKFTDDDIQETVSNVSKHNHTKKNEPPPCTLRSIDETNEIINNRSLYLVRDSKVLEMLGHTNFVTDSDDGSVSSGCETASSATSSDVEPSSLPPHLHEDFSLSKLDEKEEECEHSEVIDRVQSNDLGYQRRLTSSISDFRSESEAEYDMSSHLTVSSESAADLSSFENNSDGERRSSEEVNCVPIGEKNSFKRRSTYPPLKNLQDIYTDYGDQFETLIDNLTECGLLASSEENEVFKNSEDNVSACSDESGYSEFLENGKESSIASTIMV